MRTIDIEILRKGLDYVDEEYGALMCKSAIVALTTESHQSGTMFKVDRTGCKEYGKDARKQKVKTNFRNFKIKWTTKIHETTLLSYRDENKTTDFGAMGLAILLTLELTDYNTVLFTEGFNGIDFWLGNKEDGLQVKARLEVSGIRKLTAGNTIRQRVKVKIEQSKKSDVSKLPVYISVTAFSTPEGVFCKRTL